MTTESTDSSYHLLSLIDDNEEVLFISRPTKDGLYTWLLFGGFLAFVGFFLTFTAESGAVFFILIGLVICILSANNWFKKEVAITSKRVMIRNGLDVEVMPLNSIKSYDHTNFLKKGELSFRGVGGKRVKTHTLDSISSAREVFEKAMKDHSD